MRPDHLAPPATLVLVSLTLATYLVQVAVGGEVVTKALGFIPSVVASGRTLLRVESGQVVPVWLTLFTYVFPHGGWWHVSMNMAGLWFFGRHAEPEMGTRRFTLGYFASGVVTGLAIVLLIPSSTRPAAGASGAICGILGAALASRVPHWPLRDPRNLGLLGLEAACLVGIIAWMMIRTPSPLPDRLCAAMWHLLPLLAGWLWVRWRRQPW